MNHILLALLALSILPSCIPEKTYRSTDATIPASDSQLNMLNLLPSDADMRSEKVNVQLIYIESGTYLSSSGDLKILPEHVYQETTHWEGDARPKVANQKADIKDKGKTILITLPEN